MNNRPYDSVIGNSLSTAPPCFHRLTERPRYEIPHYLSFFSVQICNNALGIATTGNTMASTSYEVLESGKNLLFDR